MISFLFYLIAFCQPLNLKLPSDISIYKNSIYIADSGKKEVLVLDKANLKLKKTIKLDFEPYGIDIENKKIFLTSPKAKSVYILSLDGKIEKKFKFKNSPIDVIKTKKFLWISFKNGYLRAYSLNGKKKKSFNFNSYLGFLTKDKNYIYLVTPEDAKIYVINFDGKLKYFFGSFGITKGKLFRPTGIDVDKNYIYVADPIFEKVVIFTKAGSYFGYIPNVKNPLGLKVEGNKIYILDSLKPALLIRKKDEVKK